MQTVGEFLRAERLKKSLSIKDVESAISIRALYLDAIEEGKYEIVPGEVYLKGFIRNYATYLGLDSQEVMELYRKNKEKPQENELAPEPQEVKPEKPSPRKTAGGNGLLKWLAAGSLVALGVIGFIWWSSGSQPPAPMQPPSVQQQPAKNQQGTQPAPTTSSTQSVSPAKPATKVVVTAKFSAPCWTQITADGKPIYEGTPKNGESITWEATEKLLVKFGNAGVVDIVYNGTPAGKLGSNGEVVVKTFTLTGIIQ